MVPPPRGTSSGLVSPEEEQEEELEDMMKGRRSRGGSTEMLQPQANFIHWGSGGVSPYLEQTVLRISYDPSEFNQTSETNVPTIMNID